MKTDDETVYGQQQLADSLPVAFVLRETDFTIAKEIAYPEHLFPLPVKNIRHECSVRSEPLSPHRFPKSTIMLSHIPDMSALGIHNDISIRLLEA